MATYSSSNSGPTAPGQDVSLNFNVPVGKNGKTIRTGLTFGPGTIKAGFEFDFGHDARAPPAPAPQAHPRPRSPPSDGYEAPSSEWQPSGKSSKQWTESPPKHCSPPSPKSSHPGTTCSDFELDQQVENYMELQEFQHLMEMGVSPGEVQMAIRNRLEQGKDVLMELGKIQEELCPK